MQTLNQDIKNNDFKKVYLLFGEEAFLKKSYKNRLREAITQGDILTVCGKNGCRRQCRGNGCTAFRCKTFL